MLLRDVHQICADTMGGAYDEILDAMEQAVAYRKKRMKAEAGVFKGGLVRMVHDAPEIPGRVMQVLRVNKRTLTVKDVKNGIEYRVSPSLVVSVHAGAAAVALGEEVNA